jgi:hypothetical protein
MYRFAFPADGAIRPLIPPGAAHPGRDRMRGSPPPGRGGLLCLGVGLGGVAAVAWPANSPRHGLGLFLPLALDPYGLGHAD